MSSDLSPNSGLVTGRPPDFVGVLRRQYPIILLCTFAAALLTWAYVSTSSVRYESKSTILLVALPGETAPGGGRERTLDVETQATVARSTSLLQAIGDRLGLRAVDVKSSSRVEAAPTGDVLFVYFEDDNAEFAAEGALVYTEEFLAQRKATADNIAVRQRDLVQAQIDGLQQEVEDLTVEIDAEIARGDSASPTELQVLQQRQLLAIRDVAAARDQLASIDTDQTPGRVVVDPRTAVNKTGLSQPLSILGASVVGLMLGIMVALIVDRRDDRYGSAIGLDVAGLHDFGRLRYPSDSKPSTQRSSAVDRAYARLLVRLGFAHGVTTARHRSILVVAVESETLPPRATQAVAKALADEGPDNGLATTVIAPDRVTAGVAELGDANSSYWNQFASTLTLEASDHDIVFVTVGAIDRSVAALAVASKVDQTILLISEATRVNDLLTVVEDLQSVDARHIGVVVLTKVPPRRRW
jgi:hypothetical protein